MIEAADGLGKRLRIARVMTGLSQAKLAELLGTSQILVSLWETGKVYPRQRNLDKLNKVLGSLPATIKVAVRMKKEDKHLRRRRSNRE